MKRYGVLVAAALALAAAASPGEARSDRLLQLLRQECGSCHGLRLKGGLGPALVPEALSEKDAEQLRHVILHGRPGTAMPPWKRFLTEDEARWIVQRLKEGLPDAR